MRGKVHLVEVRPSFLGITPAHAGKSTVKHQNGAYSQDHPRTCGEKPSVAAASAAARGSPPHMRGKDQALKYAVKGARITPAHAGKSFIQQPVIVNLWGSPPHMRGKDMGVVCAHLGVRITPAHAGKSVTRYLSNYNTLGSPPHMRGKGGVACPCGQCVGITPAHAGKSALFSPPFDNPEDHPRTCGEKLSLGGTLCSVMGSPPHMRGKEHQRCCPKKQSGITPAHAGKSQRDHHRLCISRDHPRTCGEKELPEGPEELLPGSPPHMRGKD